MFSQLLTLPTTVFLTDLFGTYTSSRIDLETRTGGHDLGRGPRRALVRGLDTVTRPRAHPDGESVEEFLVVHFLRVDEGIRQGMAAEVVKFSDLATADAAERFL